MENLVLNLTIAIASFFLGVFFDSIRSGLGYSMIKGLLKIFKKTNCTFCRNILLNWMNKKLKEEKKIGLCQKNEKSKKVVLTVKWYKTIQEEYIGKVYDTKTGKYIGSYGVGTKKGDIGEDLCEDQDLMSPSAAVSNRY